MRRFIHALLVATVLVVPYPTLFVRAQQADGVSRKSDKPHRTDKSKKTAVSLAAKRGVETITSAQLKDYLTFIASDEMEGRDTPSRGLDITAKFLAMSMSRFGLKPAGDAGSYFQKIGLRRDIVDPEKTRVALDDSPLTIGQDYIPIARPGSASGQLIYAGNGWFIKGKDIDAYRGTDARGKIAIIFSSLDGLPRGVSRSDLSGVRGEDWMGPTEYARKQGVAALVIVPDFQYLANWERNRQRLTERGSVSVEKFQTQTLTQLPVVVVSPRIANSLFAGEKQNGPTLFESAYGDARAFPAFELSSEKRMTISIAGKNESLSTQNVVAVFEGSDPVLRNEYVALGAHYDHVGMSSQATGDSVYNGADDDGSGTTTLLAIAEALSKAPTKPKRSVLFVWHAGEEKGLWGSRYFTEYPTVPLEQIVTQINLDMIGRSKKAGDTNARNRELSSANEIYVIGSKMMSTELGELSEAVNKGYLNLVYNYRYDDPHDPNRFFFRSDHYNYARKGIPIIFFFDGEHEDYHRLGDSADKIDYQKMEQVARTVYMTLWEVANRATRPRVDKPLPQELIRIN
jgi:hypothetical protein